MTVTGEDVLLSDGLKIIDAFDEETTRTTVTLELTVNDATVPTSTCSIAPQIIDAYEE